MNKFTKGDTKIACADLRVEAMDVTEEFDGTFAPGRRLVYSCINDQVLIHINEYTVMVDHEILTMGGLCLTPGGLRVLRNKIGEIDELLWRQHISKVLDMCKIELGHVAYRAHLGAGVYVSVDNNFKRVDLRRHLVPDGQLTLVPTKEGINMPAPQWNSFKQKLNDLLSVHPELLDANEC